uniref:Uncharacterized protein n=1 Tax=Lactuca sativa TaxID=4236 RepID=A0A9R1USQ7_LACSA|nr:hypothetical protein LSAT_V11C800444800 [Lactuca sativa]
MSIAVISSTDRYGRMVVLRPRPTVDGSGEGSGSGPGSELVDERLREFIASEITRGILESTPIIFGSIKEGIVELTEDRLRTFRSDMASGQSGSRTLSFKDFRGSGAPDFHGEKDPIAARRWIADIESAQLTSFYPEGSKTTETVAEITAKYRERALLVPQYAGDEDMRRTRYHDMLRVNIREHVSFSACPTLDSMIARAREREIDLSHNKLSGPLTNLPKIEIGQTLILANNIFNESIPKSLCRWTYLEYLDLSRNRLTGKIPKCLQNLQELGAMIFSSNLLSGVIPSYIALSHSSLHWLKLDDNNFTGELP